MADQSSESKLSEEEKSDLLTFFKTQLGERVEDVRESKRLVDSPCSLTNRKTDECSDGKDDENDEPGFPDLKTSVGNQSEPSDQPQSF